MPSFETCMGCSFYMSTTFGVVCMNPAPCKYKYEPRFFWSNGTKPVGYQTPEDRLAEIERRLDRLEGRDGR